MSRQRRARQILSIAFVFGLSTTGLLPLLAPVRAEAQQPSPVRTIEIVVKGGYLPSRIEIPAGERVRLRFVRKEYNACTREVVFEALGIRRELPPNETVIIDLPALAAGEYEFKCGMNMIRGTLVVLAQHTQASKP